VELTHEPNRAVQLGLGDMTNRTVPARVGSDEDWFRVGTGYWHTCGTRDIDTLADRNGLAA
jgi:hypothetical protein